NLIYAGQRLRVPSPGGEAEPVAVLAAAEAAPIEAEVRHAVLVDAAEGTSLAAPSAAVDAGLAAEPGPEPEPEPASDDAEPSLESNVLASHQADLAADPSDYSVSGESISVQALETLGHYADWLEIRTQRLRDLNGLRFGQNVVIGQPLKLDFSRVSVEEFERRRLAYHQSLQAAFFSKIGRAHV